METNAAFLELDRLSDKDFYEKVNIGKMSVPFKWGFVSLDGLQRIITVDSSEERARARSISLGCLSPRVLEAEYFGKEFYMEHNKRLEKALYKK